MQIQMNSDHRIQGSPQLAGRVQTLLRDSLERYSDRITRVEVRLNDLNGAKGGGSDKRCLMEARVAGIGAVSADHEAPTAELAIDGAMEKLQRALGRKLGRLELATAGRRSGKGSAPI